MRYKHGATKVSHNNENATLGQPTHFTKWAPFKLNLKYIRKSALHFLTAVADVGKF